MFKGFYTQPKSREPEQPITEGKRQAARARGATHLSMDGQRAYACRLGSWSKLDWDGGFDGSWWQLHNEPVDKVKL